MTMDRQCASGLMGIATAAKQIVVDRMDVVVAGGVEFDLAGADSIELRVDADPELLAMHPTIYMAMLETAEVVARRYGISRERAGRIRAAVPAAHRRSAGRRPLRRRDRAGDARA